MFLEPNRPLTSSNPPYKASLFHELAFVSGLHDVALIHEVDIVAVLDVRHIVSDNDCRLALPPFTDGMHHLDAVRTVQGTSWLVYNEDRSIP